MKKLSTEEFIQRAMNSPKVKKEYDYSQVDYTNSKAKIKIGCLEADHGIFEIIPADFLNGHGCAKCTNRYRHNTESFIKKIKFISPQYDYSQFIYKDNRTKAKVICSKHGLFLITPTSLMLEHGCPKCYDKYSPNTEEFIEKAKNCIKVEKDYDYSQVDYKNSKTKIKIGCLEIDHGFFEVAPDCFLQGCGCPICGGTKLCNTEEFIKKAKNSPKVNKEYDYSQVDYKNSKTKVKIGCLEGDHGFFEITPNSFMQGYGCAKCCQGFGEYFAKIVFEIIYKREFTKIKPSWIINPKTNQKLELDGYSYIDYLNIYLAFEYQGRQHQEVVKSFKMTEEGLAYQKYLDQIKRDRCKDNNVILIEIPQFNHKFKPEHLKDFIKQKSIELGFPLPNDFDDIIIDVEEIRERHIQSKIIKSKIIDI